jgi:hypothetical protein
VTEVRKLLAFLAAGIALGLALGRILGWRRAQRAEAPGTESHDPRAAALRAKLDASRQEPSPPPAPPAASSPAQEAPVDVDEARRRVHERGRAAVERMRGAAGRP